MDKELQHSIDYITQKTGGKSGFSVPKNYFDGIEDSILVNLSETPIPSKKSFDVPTDYFATLEDKILARVASEEKTNPKKETNVISLKDRFVRFVPVAAAASIVLFLGTYFFTNFNKTITFDSLTATEIETWYEEGYGKTTNTDLALVFNDNELEDNELTSIDIDENSVDEYFNSVDTNNLLNDN